MYVRQTRVTLITFSQKKYLFLPPPPLPLQRRQLMRVCDFVVSLYVEEMASGSQSTICKSGSGVCLKLYGEVRQIREENCEISKREGKLFKTKRSQ